MGARQKLNSANVNGAIIIAGLFWLGTDSFVIAILVLVVLLIGSLHSGDIRPHGPQGGRGGHRGR